MKILVKKYSPKNGLIYLVKYNIDFRIDGLPSLLHFELIVKLARIQNLYHTRNAEKAYLSNLICISTTTKKNILINIFIILRQ